MSSLSRIENNWLAAPDREAEVVSQCCVCAEPICSGDGYWETADGEIFISCAEQLAAGQRFPRFFDMDEAMQIELRARKQAVEHAEKAVPSQPVDYEANKKRLQNLIKILTRRI